MLIHPAANALSERIVRYSDDTGFPLFLPEKLRYVRFLSIRHLGERPAEKTCRWCWSPVSGARRSWCSDACVDAYLIRSSAAAVTSRLRKRDNCVCAICKRDSIAIVRERYGSLRDGRPHRHWGDPFQGSAWQADHIIPVVEGGGCCGLENYRTLCTGCHLDETAALRKRMAEARDPQMRINLAGTK